jgi:hypothetical protein
MKRLSLNQKMVEEKKPALILTFSPREKEIVVPASVKSERPEFAPVQWLNGWMLRENFSLTAPLVLFVFALWFLPNRALGAELLWSNQLSQATDLTGSSGTGDLVSDPGRGAVLHFSVPHTNESAARSFPLPIERLRNRFVSLDAEVKAADVGPKPNLWNGIKVMVHLETPVGSQWPQAELPTGTFDWQRCSHRFLVPPDATAATLVLGMENVPGQAWIHDVRLVLGKELTDAPAAPANAPIFRGHSQPRLRGAMVAPDTLKESDLAVLARDWGGNLIRWQLIRYGVPTNESGYDNYDRWLDQQLNQLDRGLTWAASMGVQVVVDLHSPPSGRPINSGGYQAAIGSLWTDPNAQTKFTEVWRTIATRYRGDQRIWGYDLVNEPVDENVAEGCDDWQSLALRAAQAVRSIDPQRTLIIEPPDWGSASGFLGFHPLPLTNVVYSFHIYNPHTFTHQGLFGPSQPVTYPGRIDGDWWDKSAIERAIEPATAFAVRYRVHLYVGEFSVIRWAPGGDKYLSDLIDIVERHGWDWSYHAFREWDGWSVEHGADENDHTPTAQPTARKQVLLKWFGQNKTELNGHDSEPKR